MLTMLKNWAGQVEIDGKQYPDIGHAVSDFKTDCETIHIVLRPAGVNANTEDAGALVQGNFQEVKPKSKEYRITVKQYMTKPSNPGFDFMEKWNNNQPMPLRTMTGIIDKETRGMYHMKLHGDIWAEKITTCMCCGKKLTNPVSQYFGIGPECGGHHYVNPFDSDEELQEAVQSYKKHLQEITWEGWVVKSAITDQVEV